MKFTGKFRGDVNRLDNSVIKTINILRKKKILKTFVDVKIKKNIPVFSGLGGGTSNSFYLLKHLYKKKLDIKTIIKFEKEIGTDFRLFLNNQSYQKNLKKIHAFKQKFQFYFTLVFPNIRCSTKKIYSKVRKFNKVNHISYNRIKDKKIFIEYMKKEKNDLEHIVKKDHPVIKKVLHFLTNQEGCHYSRISGSGSICYGLFDKKKHAIKAYKKIKNKYPKYWSVITKTI